MASKRAKACDISPKVRKEVMERDGHCCIVCGDTYGLQIAHYIPRSRLGLGIPQNLGVMCFRHHMAMDQGDMHDELQAFFKEYLQGHYDIWDEKDLVYSKMKF